MPDNVAGSSPAEVDSNWLKRKEGGYESDTCTIPPFLGNFISRRSPGRNFLPFPFPVSFLHPLKHNQIDHKTTIQMAAL